MGKGVRAGKTKRPLCEGELTATARTRTHTRMHLSTGRHTGTHRLLLRYVYAKRSTRAGAHTTRSHSAPHHAGPGPSTPAVCLHLRIKSLEKQPLLRR